MQEAPKVYYDRWSGLLKHCPSSHSSTDSQGCSVCDELFFASISDEVAAVTYYFNKKVQWLLQMHLSSGVKKAILRIKHKEARSHTALIQHGQKLLQYASAMTLAAHALLEEYDKVHASTQGLHFKSRLVGMHKEILQSPWLIELLALYFNLEQNDGFELLPALCMGCKCDVINGNLSLSCMPHESLKLEIDVTCPICLEMAFEPRALTCGHMLCFSCACSVASVHTYEGLRKAKEKVKCPLCRESNVFAGAIPLTELNLLIFRRCKDYWNNRCHKERKDRLKEHKEHWKLREDVWTKPLVYM